MIKILKLLKFSLIIEGTTENVSPFPMQLKSSQKKVCFNEKIVIFKHCRKVKMINNFQNYDTVVF
jgi:hypothetical protein